MKKPKPVAAVVPLSRPPGRRAWKAAESSDLLSGWQQAARPPDVDIRRALRPLRARSREQAQNNDLMRGFLTEVKSNVIGPRGIKLQGRNEFANGRRHKRLNKALEAAYSEWGKRGSCDVTGQLSITDLSRLALTSAATDGEFLVRKVGNWDNRFGFALQVIDPEALDVGYDEDLGDGRRVVMGVELDAWRRPVAYYLTEEPTNPYMSAFSQHAKRERVPAADIIHGYLPEWCWQTRGVPWAASALWRLKMVGGYEEAAVTAARGAASKMAFYKHDADSGAPVGLEGERNESGDLMKDAAPGTMEELPPGYSVDVVDWGWPNSDHQNFMRPVLRSIAAGLGVSYNSWARDLEGVNYSSLRHGTLTERDLWRSLQQWAIEWLMEPIFDAWLESAIMMGAIAVGGVPLTLDPSRLRKVVWQPRGWQWVDPQKEADAAKQALRMRTRSVSSIIRERGEDPDEVWQELADDLAKLDELGLSFDESQAQQEPEPQPDEDD